MDVKSYIKAARLRTLPLSISGIIVGGLIALSKDMFDWVVFLLALLTTIGFQVLSNFANDYGDGVKGTDNERKGEERMVASGAITPNQMKKAMVVTTIITLITALFLIYLAFGKDNFQYSILFFLLGVASIAAAIKYTVGKTAYGYSGYGDFFVFVFFGLLSVVGSYFLFTKEINFYIFLPAFSVGMLSTAVLNLNNMRDRVNDEKVGKNTIVVKIGNEFAKYYHYYLIGASLLFALAYISMHYVKPIQFIFLIAYIPLFRHMLFVYHNKDESQLDGQLKIVALSTFLFSILFGIGLVV
ncbi:1,4-dihydroxy-2-naphthoate octaprenyltransferase [Pseudotenacibaculum sp. MALMAid0570]|uniref:1,4-dihydroxy-2-naphthoate octaprenyltransferase n=1 Tax=Pseudotenacibaculum sp. MALMAid0570 TaxID=3143938 RepID=UPI0032DF4A4F